MATVRFLHTSDWQAGMRRWFLSAEAQARFDAARINAVRELGEVALEQGCEFIVVAGDVFEHNSVEKQTIARVLEALHNLPVPVFLLPGNHDPLTADSPFSEAAKLDNVTVLDSSTPQVVGDSGVELVGAPWRSKTVSHDLVSQALAPLEATDAVRILVGHGQVEGRGAEFAPELLSLPAMEEAYRQRRVDFLALGDTHSTQAVGSSGAVWFSGSPETTDYHERGLGGHGDGGENDSGNALVVTVTKDAGVNTPAQVDVEIHRIGRWIFDAVEWDINTVEDVSSIVEFLEAYPNKADTAVKYALRGSVDMTTMQALELELDRLRPLFAALYERQRLMDLAVIPSADELSEHDLTGYAAEAFEELATSTDPAAQDAVRLLFRLAKDI